MCDSIIPIMSRSKAEVAKDLYNEFIREIGEVAIAGDDESDIRNESVKHLLTARSRLESLMRQWIYITFHRW